MPLPTVQEGRRKLATNGIPESANCVIHGRSDFWRTDHAHHHDGSGLDDRLANIRSLTLTTGRQGAGTTGSFSKPCTSSWFTHHLACASGPIRALEQRVEAVLAIEPGRYIRSFLRCARGDEGETAHLVQMFDSTVVRAHVSAAGAKRGQNNQALGRSRGGFSTKIHLMTDFGGPPIAFHLAGGEASDSRNFETLLDIGPDINPRAALGDKGYYSKSNREAARQRGLCPAIPYRFNTKDIPAFFPKVLYKGRARIE